MQEVPVPQQKKFTGRNNDSNNSGIVISSTRNTVVPPREQMIRNEFNLVNRATGPTGLAIQAGLAALMLLFYLYIGFTGGIVSGNEVSDLLGGADEIQQFDQIIPIPRDAENTVWL